MQDRAKNLERIARELEGTLFNITHEGSDRIIAEHERRIAEIEALRAKDGSNAQQVDQLIAQSAAVRDAQLSQLRAKEVEAAEKVRAANERVVASLDPFGFLRPWNEMPALFGSAPPATPPSTGTGVITFLMG